MENYLSGEEVLDFDEFANQLLEQGAEQSPAHLQGAICGILAGAGARDPEYCLASASQALELGLHGELAENCLRLADVTLKAMADDGFDFQLFLPDDEVEMEHRIQALADWCSGFLAGYSMSVADPGTGALDEEAAEVLKDIAAIAEATVDAERDPDEAENHFFELTEYLRLATLNLFVNAVDARDSTDPGQV